MTHVEFINNTTQCLKLCIGVEMFIYDIIIKCITYIT